jgi:hypothetical protein
MGSSHAPEAGADAIPYDAYKVRVEDEVGDRRWISVSAAMGPNDARNQAVQKAIDEGYQRVTALDVVPLGRAA